jgi:hypothetical protein
MNMDDILGRLRDEYPAQMAAVDAVLFRAGFMTMDRVLIGFEEQVRAAVLDKIPQANGYFYENMPSSDSAGGRKRSRRARRL